MCLRFKQKFKASKGFQETAFLSAIRSPLAVLPGGPTLVNVLCAFSKKLCRYKHVEITRFLFLTQMGAYSACRPAPCFYHPVLGLSAHKTWVRVRSTIIHLPIPRLQGTQGVPVFYDLALLGQASCPGLLCASGALLQDASQRWNGPAPAVCAVDLGSYKEQSLSASLGALSRCLAPLATHPGWGLSDRRGPE